MRILGHRVHALVQWQPEHRRVRIQLGDQTLVLTPAEAIDIANQLVDQVEKGNQND